MAKGAYVLVAGEIREIEAENIGRDKRIYRLYNRYYLKGKLNVGVFERLDEDSNAKPPETYSILNKLIFLERIGNKNPIDVSRRILEKENSLLVSLLDGCEIKGALKKYGRDGDAVSEVIEEKESPKKPVRRAA